MAKKHVRDLVSRYDQISYFIFVQNDYIGVFQCCTVFYVLSVRNILHIEAGVTGRKLAIIITKVNITIILYNNGLFKSSIIHISLLTILYEHFIIQNSGHFELANMAAPMSACSGALKKSNQYGLNYICAKFHACRMICTIDYLYLPKEPNYI